MSIFKVADKFKNTLTSASTQMKWDLHKTADYASRLADSVDNPETRKLAEQTHELWSMVAADNVAYSQIKIQLKAIAQLSEHVYVGLKTASDKKQLVRLMQTIQDLQPMDSLHATASSADATRYLQQLGAKSLKDLTDAQVIEYYRLKDPANVNNFAKYSPDVQNKLITQLRDVPVSETSDSPPPPTASPTPKKPAPKSFAPPVPKKPIYDNGDLINKDIQKALISLFPGSEKWIKVDGIFGPNTRGAINRYKATYHDDRNMTDPAFQADLIGRGERAEVEGAINRPMQAKSPWESR